MLCWQVTLIIKAAVVCITQIVLYTPSKNNAFDTDTKGVSPDDPLIFLFVFCFKLYYNQAGSKGAIANSVYFSQQNWKTKKQSYQKKNKAPFKVQVQCCFTSTETIRTIRDGQPATATLTWLSHSSWALQSTLTHTGWFNSIHFPYM